MHVASTDTCMYPSCYMKPACHSHVGVMFYAWISNMHVASTDTCMYPSCYMKHVMSACYLLVDSPCMHAWCYNIIFV